MGLAERALFAACAERRISNGAEYFFGSETVFRLALDAIAANANGRPEVLAAFHGSRPFEHLEQMPGRDFGMGIRTALRESAAVYLLRNPWHADHVYRYALTTLSGVAFVKEMERRQRMDNGVFGFYRVVCAFPVDDPKIAKRVLRVAAKPFTFTTRFSFLRGHLEDIKSTLRQSLAIAGPKPSAPPVLNTGNPVNAALKPADGIWAEPVTNPNKSERPWNPPCLHCGQLLRFRHAAIGVSGILFCPSCKLPLMAHIGGSASTVSLLP